LPESTAEHTGVSASSGVSSETPAEEDASYHVGEDDSGGAEENSGAEEDAVGVGSASHASVTNTVDSVLEECGLGGVTVDSVHEECDLGGVTSAGYLSMDGSAGGVHEGPREKFVFLVRHAQSRWNVQLEKVSKYSQIGTNLAQAGTVIGGAAVLTKEIGQGLFMNGYTDHELSEKGVQQAQALQEAIVEEHAAEGDRCEAQSVYYKRFLGALEEGLPVYSSPMLRALQTAHLALPAEAGWGSIVLLKDAREVLNTLAERDCVGAAVDEGIVERAMDVCTLPGLDNRVDWSASDCEGQWWSSDAESEHGINERMHSLLQRLLEDDQSSCVCVTHSNLIRRLMMRYGAVDSKDRKLTLDSEFIEEFLVDSSIVSQCSVVQPSWADDAGSWEVVDSSAQSIQRTKVDKLQNCGVLGVRFAFEDQQWLARDVCLMFNSQFQSDLDMSE